MNILALVFAVLMILGLFTNYQMDSYRQFRAVKDEYNDYIEKKERESFNDRQERLYDGIKGKKNTQDPNTQYRKAEGNARLNLRLILDKKKRDEKSEESKQHLILLKDLIRLLFGKTEDYLKLEEKRPNFIDEIFKRLFEYTDEKPLKFTNDLDKIDLEDEELQLVFYQFLKGIPTQQNTEANVLTEDTDEEVAHTEEEDIFRSEKGIISIKDFVHMNGNQPKIRVYLASAEVLMTIFQNPDVVSSIIEKREEIYAQLNKYKDKDLKSQKDIATQQFEQFRKNKRSDIKDELLDFTVTKVDPKTYR